MELEVEGQTGRPMARLAQRTATRTGSGRPVPANHAFPNCARPRTSWSRASPIEARQVSTRSFRRRIARCNGIPVASPTGEQRRSRPHRLGRAFARDCVGQASLHSHRMIDKQPFTIEILGFDRDRPVIVDRVIGGSVYFEEAKRIGPTLAIYC